MADCCENSVPTKGIEKAECSERMRELLEFFSQEYGYDPEFFVKVPGRVNIIGEHIDYCGYPVLPMALEQNILLAVSATNDGLLHLRNINKKYENFKCDLNKFPTEMKSTSGTPNWYSYFLCGVRGILEHINKNKIRSQLNFGMSIAVSGNIPPASGLSSSSALVSSATLATAYLCKIPLNPQDLADISARCERYIGTQGGGMDQAIAFLGKQGCAQFIRFQPTLKAEPVKLPKSAHFVVANSLAEMNKAATSDFNERVVECRIACRILAKKFCFNNWKELTRFAQLQETLNCKLEELEQLANQVLFKETYTKENVLEELNITEEEFKSDFLTANTHHMELFKLRQRTLHVLRESKRVWEFRQLCDNGNGDIKNLSRLMKESHQSLRTLYECSHPNLDQLVEMSSKMGIGARLTGAGWGGCIVALCDSQVQCNEYIKELKEKYYKNLPQAKDTNLDHVIFSTCPQSGAEIFFFL